MIGNLKKLRIFAASPSDVAGERAKLGTIVESLKPMADYLGLTLEVVDWRIVVPDVGRPQQIIFNQLKPTSWDIFIGILWHRFGIRTGEKDKTGTEYLSGTEEEFKTAYELWKQHNKPRMVIYRCIRALPFDVDPDQLKNVHGFFRLIEDVKGDYPTLYQTFDTTESFEKLVLNNLQRLLVEYGKQVKTPVTPEVQQVLAPKIPNNLPRRQAFFGRDKELETVMRALNPDDRTWGVLLDGIGGIGKSAIAIESAHRVHDAGLFEAFVFVTAKTSILDPNGIKELSPLARTLDEFFNETARILGQSRITKLTGEEKRHALIDALQSIQTLLIYDNLETLSKEEQEEIADFLRELPQGCKAIITSRRRGGEGGVWLRVGKLDWDAARGIIDNQMSLDAGLADRLNHAGGARWQELFDETNGSPLVLVHTLGLMRLRAALTFDGVLEMLRGNQNEELQKFIFHEARKELTENDRVALGALSFFVPSAPFETWMLVAKVSRNALETTIERLIALSLVNIIIGEERYALHPLTRVFVREEVLVDEAAAHEIGLRFAQCWLGYVKQYGGEEKESYKTYNQLDAEWANLDTAADWLAHARSEYADNTELAEMLSDFAMSLMQFLQFRGRWDELIRLGIMGYDAASASGNWIAASSIASTCFEICSSRGLENYAEVWSTKTVAATKKMMGEMGVAFPKNKTRKMRKKATWTGKSGQIITDSFNSLLKSIRSVPGNREMKQKAIYRAKQALIHFYKAIGEAALAENNYSLANQNYHKALDLARKSNDKQNHQLITYKLGEIALAHGHLKRARKWFDETLSLAQEIHNVVSIADAQYGLARVYKAEEQSELSLSLAQEALKVYERLQHGKLKETRKFMESLKGMGWLKEPKEG
jgi:tetratricopeptide (TPR) repeat protein